MRSTPWDGILVGAAVDDCEWIAGNALKEENLYFHSNFLIKSLLRHLVQSQSFSIGIIKRVLHQYRRYLPSSSSDLQAPCSRCTSKVRPQAASIGFHPLGAIFLLSPTFHDGPLSHLLLFLLPAPLGCSENLLLFHYVALHRIWLAHSLFIRLHRPSLSCFWQLSRCGPLGRSCLKRDREDVCN